MANVRFKPSESFSGEVGGKEVTFEKGVEVDLPEKVAELFATEKKLGKIVDAAKVAPKKDETA